MGKLWASDGIIAHTDTFAGNDYCNRSKWALRTLKPIIFTFGFMRALPSICLFGP